MHTKRIDSFRGEYRFLSNFYPSRVKYCGVGFASVEHAYVAAKHHDWQHFRNVMLCDTPGEAKKLGRKVPLRDSWDYEKLFIMYDLLRQKFNDKELRDKLILTGSAYLEEGNTWGDVVWGVCDGKGENHLGKLLMTLRDQLMFRGWMEARPDWITGHPDWASYQ